MSRWYELEQEVYGIGRSGERFASRLRVARVDATSLPSGARASRLAPGAADAESRSRPTAALRAERAPRRTRPVSGEATRTDSRRRARLRGAPRGIVFDRVFPDPGCYVRVPFSCFESELSAQLASPERVAPGQLVDCIVQIYRIFRPLPIERLTAFERGDGGMTVPRQLTAVAAGALGFAEPARRRSPEARPSRAPGIARPGERYWTLRVVSDPSVGTADEPATQPDAEAQ